MAADRAPLWTGEGADARAGHPITIPNVAMNPAPHTVVPGDPRDRTVGAFHGARMWAGCAPSAALLADETPLLYPSVVEPPRLPGETQGPAHWIGTDGRYLQLGGGQPNFVWPGVCMEWRNPDGVPARSARGADGRELPATANADGVVEWLRADGFHREDVDAEGSSLPARVGKRGSRERVFARAGSYFRVVRGVETPVNATAADGTECCYVTFTPPAAPHGRSYGERPAQARLHTENAGQPSEYNPETKRRAWHHKGKLHGPAPGAPAETDPTAGVTRWYSKGKAHRDPAPSGISQPAEVWEERPDRPATEHYFRGGLRHRPPEEGPATVDEEGRPGYFFAGEPHRLDGPATVKPDGALRYAVEGVDCTRAEMQKAAAAFASRARKLRLQAPAHPDAPSSHGTRRDMRERGRERSGGRRR
jgi:hypothetical protein